MKKKYIALFTFFIFFSTAISSSPVEGYKIKNSTEISLFYTIYVDDDNVNGPWEGTFEHPYRFIQDAVENSISEGTIYVFNGIYYENFVVDKTLSIIGEDKINTIIDGMYENFLIQITAGNVLFDNFTIRNSAGYSNNAGIVLNSDNNLVKNCIFYKTKTGVFINNTVDNSINNCTFQKNGNGVILNQSNRNIIEGCCFSHNSLGIHIKNSDNNIIRFSHLNTNGIACLLTNSSYNEIFHCNISDNSVNLGGVYIIECSNIYITNSIIRHTGTGISISQSSNISINYCSLYFNTHYAISVRSESYDIKIEKSEIRDNSRYGFYIERDNYCDIRENNIYNNSLYCIYSIGGNCIAKDNWWGSHFGPSYSPFRSGCRISWITGKIKFFPWVSRQLEDVGADWQNNKPYMDDFYEILMDKVIELPGEDSDNDGAPDWWEEKWGYNPNCWEDHIKLDPDCDALTNIEECYTDEYGSNPFYKDIFLEIDWLVTLSADETNKPPLYLIEKIIDNFAEKDINLHVDIGNLGGGEEISTACHPSHFSFDKLQDLYWDYFLHNDLNNPRKDIFHYGIICNYCPDLNFPFFGWDNLDSFAISAEWLKDYNKLLSRGRLIVGAAVHHLGHTLGLIADSHGGIDNLGSSRPFTLEWLKYVNYKSCLNYFYKYKMFDFSDGTHGRGDYDDWGNFDFSFFKNSHFNVSIV